MSNRMPRFASRSRFGEWTQLSPYAPNDGLRSSTRIRSTFGFAAARVGLQASKQTSANSNVGVFLRRFMAREFGFCSGGVALAQRYPLCSVTARAVRWKRRKTQQFHRKAGALTLQLPTDGAKVDDIGHVPNAISGDSICRNSFLERLTLGHQ